MELIYIMGGLAALLLSVEQNVDLIRSRWNEHINP
jgi:hypothetical protein